MKPLRLGSQGQFQQVHQKRDLQAHGPKLAIEAEPREKLAGSGRLPAHPPNRGADQLGTGGLADHLRQLAAHGVGSVVRGL